jgi:hypothetical protein
MLVTTGRLRHECRTGRPCQLRLPDPVASAHSEHSSHNHSRECTKRTGILINFKYRKLILFLSICSFVAGLLNLGFYFSGGPRCLVISGVVCVLLGAIYLMVLGIYARPK